MDDLSFDDFDRNPNALRPDPELGLAEARREFDSVTPETHEQQRAAAAPFLMAGIGHEVFGNDNAALVVDDPEQIKRVKDAELSDASKAAEQAAHETPSQPPDGAPVGAPPALPAETPFDSPAEKTPDENAPQAPQAPKPTELESTLAAIRLNGDRQRRLIISGDPEIQARFYAKLADRKQLYYQGGVPMITLSHDKAIKVLMETAREMEGSQAVHALSLKAERDGGGFFGSVKAGALNLINAKQHQLDVVVVGNRDTVEKKLTELGGLVSELDSKHLVTGGANAVKGGTLSAGSDGPIKLTATDKLYAVLDVAASKVVAHEAAKMELQTEKRARQDSKDAAEIQKAKDKENPNAVHDTASKLARNLDESFADKGLLAIRSGNQSTADKLLQQAKSLGDPVKPELQTLPDSDRQKAIVQLAALVTKVDNKEFDSAHDSENTRPSKNLDREHKNSHTIREKVDAYIAMEAKRDPEFAAKAQATLQDLSDRKLITAEQSELVTQKLADAVALAHPTKAADESTKGPTTDSEKAQDATPAAVSNADATAVKEVAPTTAQAESTAEHTAESTQASVSTQSGSATTEAASKGSAPTEPLAQAETHTAAESHSGTHGHAGHTMASAAPVAGLAASHATVQEAASVSQSATSNEPSAASRPTPLRDRIEALSKEGPSALTEKKADELVTALDGIRSKPLAALDSRTGTEPTQTIADAKALLSDVQTGRFGADLQARAKDLSEPMQRWSSQDDARYAKAAAIAPVAGRTASSIERPAVATSATSSGSTQRSAAATETTASPAAQAQQPSSAEQLAKEQAAQRTWETESAGAKLSQLMANPAGSFTHRDKSWDETNIQRAAQEVLRIDPDSVSQLSSSQRNKIAAYSAWVAENASNGKLPGFSSGDGKAQASQLVERAAALIGKMDNGTAFTPDVEKTLAKANRLVDAQVELQKTAAYTNGAANEVVSRGSIGPAAAKALSSDVVHSVFNQKEVRDAQVKYLLKNAGNLTPDALKALPAQDQAKTAVAISHLAQSARDGALGEFAKLPSALQKSVLSAGQAGDALLSSLQKDPAMRAELNQAYNELHGRSTSTSRGTEASVTKPAGETVNASKSATAAEPKAVGRSMDR